MKFDQSKIEKTLKNKGYAYFENGEYNLNIVGIRNSDTGKRVTNQFDDWMTLSYKENGVWKYLEWPCTVDNGDGTARLVEGQYRGSFTIGLHQGKYTALKQCKQLKVYRDLNLKDGTYDESKIYNDVAGLNIHKAGVDSQQVNNWSEGCQVFKKAANFDDFIEIVKKSSTFHGLFFTYTLINSNDINIANPPIV